MIEKNLQYFCDVFQKKNYNKKKLQMERNPNEIFRSSLWEFFFFYYEYNLKKNCIVKRYAKAKNKKRKIHPKKKNIKKLSIKKKRQKNCQSILNKN